MKILFSELVMRAAMAGRDASSVSECITHEYGDGWVDVNTTHAAYPSDAKGVGLGDMVAAGLDAVGITKARVQSVASAFGIKDCGCKKRQNKLNELGRKFGIG